MDIGFIPADTKYLPNIGLMFCHRLRRWPNIIPTLFEYTVFAGILVEIDLNRLPEFISEQMLNKMAMDFKVIAPQLEQISLTHLNTFIRHIQLFINIKPRHVMK